MDAQHQCSTFDMTCKGFKPIQVSKSDAHLGFQNIGFRHFWGCFWFSVSLQCQWLQSGNCADHCTAPPSHCNFKANKTFQTLSFCIGIISAGTEGDIHMTHTQKDKNTGQQAQTQKTTVEQRKRQMTDKIDQQTNRLTDLSTNSVLCASQACNILVNSSSSLSITVRMHPLTR